MELEIVTTEGTPPPLAMVTNDPLRELFDAHYGGMVRLAALLLGETAAAEDVVQDAFIAVDRHLPRIDPSARHAYLRRAVVNHARSAGRRNRALKRQIVVTPDEPVMDPEMAALGQDRQRRIVAAMAQLSERQRHCLVLRYYGGMSDGEIANHLKLAVGSVKNHIHRGRRALQMTLGDLR